MPLLSRPGPTAPLPRAVVATCVLLGLAACASAAPGARGPEPADWIQLFNGRNLDGWTPKFANHPLGENFHDTFRVEDGLLRVRYDRWPSWTGEMGHLFYERPFSHYIISAEYRFVDDQPPGTNLAWAKRNNGLMLHAQAPETMALDQGYPNSMEVQLLGGLGEGPRTTANLCTPGTVFEQEGVLKTAHCTNSTSATYDGDQWVHVEVLVLGDSIIKHIVEGDTVFTYSRPQLGEVPRGQTAESAHLTPITSGYITIQAESAPTDFRKIEVLDLEGCMDPEASNYRSYFVESSPSRCTY